MMMMTMAIIIITQAVLLSFPVPIFFTSVWVFLFLCPLDPPETDFGMQMDVFYPPPLLICRSNNNTHTHTHAG